MNAVFTFVLMFGIAISVPAAELLAQIATTPRVLQLRNASALLRIDGVIDDAWSEADSTSAFVQHSPSHNQSPSRKTIAKVLTNGNSLYCLMICMDDAADIEAHNGILDDGGGDFVSLMIDTFGDGKSAYKFAVSAGGVRTDARLLDDARNRDYNWDGVWFADALVYDWGYVVEMEIPFRSIQYDPALESWGLDFDRWIPGLAEDIYWCPYNESEGQRISKFGRLQFNGVRPSIQGLSLEFYPVAIGRLEYLREGTYTHRPDAGLDMFYNPSPVLTLQATVNPDFAQIEADPFSFNISRYETYFSERRPFFTEGNEIFMAAGKQHNSGFYKPLELFYSRRIGRKLADGGEVPLLAGAKAFGRVGDWEYGGFTARTGETQYTMDGDSRTEEAASFAAGRMKHRLLENSDVGMLLVGRWSEQRHSGVLDVDGALRESSWQLAWQLARSFNSAAEGGYAASAGFTMPTEHWLVLVRGRAVDTRFDVADVGYVPWRGTAELVALTGPTWYLKDNPIRYISLYGGGALGYEDADLFTDLIALLGGNLSFRANHGGEINLSYGRAKDGGQEYTSYEANFSTWFNIHPRWSANVWGGYSRGWNFARDWLGFYTWAGMSFSCKPTTGISFEVDLNTHCEGNPDNEIVDVIVNSRPGFTIVPVNDLSIRLYVDNTYRSSSDRIEQWITGLLFSWNFLPKSWVYFAINDLRDIHHPGGSTPAERAVMRVRDQAAVLKLKYLYYL
ncbi:MAG: carbohydrate binding family 9 domain-containing protein [Bacteroidia bacterium]|nr:carbohydrate binding family 9 domain-containing protein [Bacteroidia bacterium]